MANFNKVYLIGNLTRDPELRVTPKGTAICQFGLAVNRQFKDEAGNMRDETTFVDIEAWGRQGETISKYCQKGRPLFVEVGGQGFGAKTQPSESGPGGLSISRWPGRRRRGRSRRRWLFLLRRRRFRRLPAQRSTATQCSRSAKQPRIFQQRARRRR